MLLSKNFKIVGIILTDDGVKSCIIDGEIKSICEFSNGCGFNGFEVLYHDGQREVYNERYITRVDYREISDD